MQTIAHIINVTEINESKLGSYLHIAQPMTMKSMAIAKAMATGVVNVDLVAVKHHGETVDIPPEIAAEFQWAPNLEKYAWEYIQPLHTVEPHKPLPRLHDIIHALYQHSKADYFIYTNLDIGLYPDFYLRIAALIQEGYDAICVNRIDLPKEAYGVLIDDNHFELALTLSGQRHQGIDCFVFKRSMVPKLKLGNVYIGFPPVGQVLKTQIESNAQKFVWITEETLTFHIGRDNAWKHSQSPYRQENMTQAEGLYIPCLGKNRPKTPLNRRVIGKIKGMIKHSLSSPKC